MSLKANISLNFISQIVNLFTSFGASILLARVLGPEGRGDYILILTSAGFLVQFFTFGIESSITHFIASNKIDRPKLLFSVLVFYCVHPVADHNRDLTGFILYEPFADPLTGF